MIDFKRLIKCKHRKIFLFLTLIVWGACPVNAEVRLPKIVSDGMVLQRDAPIVVWGWADANEKVTVTFLEKTYKTKADRRGEWKIVIPKQPVGGPYSMVINNLAIKNILIGEVWLCSGQSNMELQLRRVMDLYRSEILRINNPNIHYYKTPYNYNYEDSSADLLDGAKWVDATPENIMEFSAAAWFFASELYQKINVPIGIINSSVGGTPIEQWISPDAIKQFPAYAAAFDKKSDAALSQSAPSATFENPMQRIEREDEGKGAWYKAIDDSEWETTIVPGYWRDKGIDMALGVIWLRKTFEVPANMMGKVAQLRLGCIVDSDSTFVNGEFAGNVAYRYPPRIYPLRAGLLKEGKNTVAVRIVGSYRGGMVEEKPYKIIIPETEQPYMNLGGITGYEIDLAGEWKYRIGAQMKPDRSTTPPFAGNSRPNVSALFNGMIAPLKNIPFKGVIWYQGESNTGNGKQYGKLLTALINDWRETFRNPALPFIYVQLPGINKEKPTPAESGSADVREGMRQTLTLPNVAMAVTIDLGEWNDIHPLRKKEVGQRLAAEAGQLVYHQNTAGSPLYKTMEYEDKAIVLTFDCRGGELDSNCSLHGFEIAGADGTYSWAEATVVSPCKVKVRNNNIENPVSVRYAWADNPERANLRNKAGLPASPFCTK
ncbi:MAG: hypothetical protein LBG96_11965 [Tannerella sp.]|jgi:sialate O-acetylesterase|nr:hypothetical protein [Tannerella sp.]